MAEYTSGSLRVSGLGSSSTDFDDMIAKMKKIEMMPAEKLLKWKSDWNVRLEAFGEIRTKLASFSSFLSTINTESKFLTKNAISSNPNSASATATSDAAEGNYTIQVNKLATSSNCSLQTAYTDKFTNINTTGVSQKFVYKYKDEEHTIMVPADTNLEGLKNIINNNPENPGIKANMIQSSSGIVFQVFSTEQGESSKLEIMPSTSLADFYPGQTLSTTFNLDSLSVNTTGASKQFKYKLDGVEHSVAVPDGTTLADLKNLINDDPTNPGATAELVRKNGTGAYELRLTPTNTDQELTFDADAAWGDFVPVKVNWMQNQGQDAEIRVNGWPSTGWLTSKSNAVTNVIDGVTINLYAQDTTTNVSVAIDRTKVKENVVAFVDKMNEVRSMFKTMTEVNQNKNTVQPEYTDSQYDMQKGSVLTGNYGVQLMISKLKTCMMDVGKGFIYGEVDSSGKLVSGDLFSSLAQLGIQTDSKEGSATFGLLKFNDNTDLMTFDKALEQDPQAIAELFSAKLKTSTNSKDFGVDSVMPSFTKPGIYGLQYTVGPDPDDLNIPPKNIITSASVNGKAAKIVKDTNQIFLVRDPDHPVINNADGITLNVYNMEPGSYNGEVGVKSGKVPELQTMIDVDFLDADNGATDTTKGTLSVLETQYKAIMNNIDKKVMLEDERIIKWERMTINRFARLDALLGKYEGLAAQLESQVKQLSSGS